MKSNKIYIAINIASAIVSIVLIALIFILKEQKVFIGVLFRGVLSLFIIYNSLYIIFTNNPSFMLRNSFLLGKWQEKHRKVFGIILLLFGIFTLVTVLLGYGLNGLPLLDWSTVFK